MSYKIITNLFTNPPLIHVGFSDMWLITALILIFIFLESIFIMLLRNAEDDDDKRLIVFLVGNIFVIFITALFWLLYIAILMNLTEVLWIISIGAVLIALKITLYELLIKPTYKKQTRRVKK